MELKMILKTAPAILENGDEVWLEVAWENEELTTIDRVNKKAGKETRETLRKKRGDSAV